MPRLAHKRVLIIDRSALAKNMYTLLFENVARFKFEYAESLQALQADRSKHIDLVIANSNVFEKWANDFPTLTLPTLLLIGADRLDLRNHYEDQKYVQFIAKPFYPYDLLSQLMAHAPYPKTERLVGAKKRGRKRKKNA